MAKPKKSAKPPAADMKKIKARVKSKVKRANDQPLNLSMVIYARPKTGKTRFCATMPKVLIIDVDEEGTDSTRDDTNPWTIRVRTWTELLEIYWFLQEGDHDFESFAIDTVSAMQTLAMNFVLGDEVARDASRDPDQPSQRVYQKVSQLMKTQITNFRNLPLNCVFTAHTRTREVGEGEEEMTYITGPNIQPAVSSHLLGAVGMIGYMTKREVRVKIKGSQKKVKRTRVSILVAPSERYETGVRYSALKDFERIDNPDFMEIMKLIKQGGKSGKK